MNDKQITKLCTRCHKEPVEWDFGDEAYCQMCWEAVTSESYWRWYDDTKGVFCNPDLFPC